MIRKDVTDTWVPGGKTTASPSVTCTGYDAPVSVVECMFDGGHDCDMPYIPTTGWAFMRMHTLDPAGASIDNGESYTGYYIKTLLIFSVWREKSHAQKLTCTQCINEMLHSVYQ
jgi:hypothetical protein